MTTENIPDSPWVTRRQAAVLLRVNPATVDRYRRQGRLTKYNVAGQNRVRFLRADVEALVEAA